MSSDEREREGGGCEPIVYSDPRGSSSLSCCPLGSMRQAVSARLCLQFGWPTASEKMGGEGQCELLPLGRTVFPVCHLCPFQDKDSMRQVMQAVDKANGCSFGDQEHRSLEALMSAAVGADFHFASYPSPPILLRVGF